MNKLKSQYHNLHFKYFIVGVFLALGSVPLSGVAASCTVSTVSINFGTYNVYTTTNTVSTGQVKVVCNPLTAPYTVALNGGTYGTITQRKQGSGSNTLLYNLYSDPARTVLWGDGSTNGTTVSSSSSTPLNVYGSIPALQNVSVGSYSDNVSVTVTF